MFGWLRNLVYGKPVPKVVTPRRNYTSPAVPAATVRRQSVSSPASSNVANDDGTSSLVTGAMLGMMMNDNNRADTPASDPAPTPHTSSYESSSSSSYDFGSSSSYDSGGGCDSGGGGCDF